MTENPASSKLVRGGVYALCTSGKFDVWKIIEVDADATYATSYREVFDSLPTHVRTRDLTPQVLSTPCSEEFFLGATLLAVEAITETELSAHRTQFDLQSQWYGP